MHFRRGQLCPNLAAFGLCLSLIGADVALHHGSPQDSINPPDQAERIMSLCGGGANKHVHGGGHTVMQDEAAIGTYSEFFFGS